jgi:hypothetical protein
LRSLPLECARKECLLEENLKLSSVDEEKSRLGTSQGWKVTARKPSFEVGASQPLSFAKKPELPKVCVHTTREL